MYNDYSTEVKISRYKQVVYFEKDLFIETYIIGYKNEGESILFFVRADGGISFSGLVDCYKLDDVDKVKDILQENEIEKLDFICWTHPDLDHSKGLVDIIKNYVSQKTNIWIPEGVDAQEITCSKDVKELFIQLKKCMIDMDAEYNVYSASDRKDMMGYNSICFQKGVDIFPLEIISYAPNSKIIRKQNYTDKFIKNDRSVFFVLALGSARIFLTGDVEDSTIEKIPSNFFEKHIHIMKIPHHGSDSSDKMLDLGWQVCDVACSTVYRKGHSDLPLANIMKRYSEVSQYLLCTGKADRTKETEKYGIVKIVTDIIENSFSTYTEGNAESWANQIYV